MTNKLINYFAFGVLALLWLVFLAAVVIRPDALTTAWETFRAWPVIVQIIVGLLTLPVALGLWIWSTGWAYLLKLVLVLALAWVTVYTFFPKKARRA